MPTITRAPRRAFRWAATVAAGLLASSALLVVSAPASSADVVAGATVSAPNGVRWSGCHEHPMTYAVAVPEGAEGWSLDVRVLGPDGLEVTREYLYDADPVSGTAGLQVCGGLDPAGTYTLTGTFTWTDASYDDHPVGLAPSTFVMRLPQTVTTLRTNRANPRKGQKFTLTAYTKDERPFGYFPTPYADVVLQRLVGGTWRTIGSGSTSDQGRSWGTFKWRSNRPIRYRVVTKTSDGFSGSVSNVIRIR